MSYILKDSSQGIISVKLTDAGRKKLSKGRLNIELFQVGDSEYCYDCNGRLPALVNGVNIQQANFNAQNLNPIPEKNKAHVTLRGVILVYHKSASTPPPPHTTKNGFGG